ncbi:MAG TPA: ribosome maturation factor RimM, partial [Candidatus Dormibacteraeota bacterium]|nr:ribosome maturation factor RimM [Candidatus Dormibacteraeota bacterium]
MTKPHGIKGEVIVRLITDRPERLEPGSVLSSDRGPLTVLASRPHQRDFIV